MNKEIPKVEMSDHSYEWGTVRKSQLEALTTYAKEAQQEIERLQKLKSRFKKEWDITAERYSEAIIWGKKLEAENKELIELIYREHGYEKAEQLLNKEVKP